MRTRVALLVAASLLFTACSSSDESDAVAEPTAQPAIGDIRLASGSFTVGYPTEEPSPTFHNVPPGEAPTTTAAPASTFGITDVQIQDGRAVFALFGDGVLNYVGRYVDEAGTSLLQVDLISSPSSQRGPDRPALSSSGGAITSVRTTDPTDGVTQAFIETSAERPNFTVTTQQDPPSLIVAVF